MGLGEFRRFFFSIEKETTPVTWIAFDARSTFQVAAVAMIFLWFISCSLSIHVVFMPDQQTETTEAGNETA